MLFPGQGSQSLGMLADLAAQHAVIGQTFQEASDALGYDLWALCQNGPETDLNRTDRTQPAILAASIALWRLWCEQSAARPAFVAGHSLGEYSALAAAGVLGIPETLDLVALRGKIMHEAGAEVAVEAYDAGAVDSDTQPVPVLKADAFASAITQYRLL